MFCVMVSNTKSVLVEYKQLYHVQFSQDFQEVQILASSLETTIDFTLSEWRDPLLH